MDRTGHPGGGRIRRRTVAGGIRSLESRRPPCVSRKHAIRERRRAEYESLSDEERAARREGMESRRAEMRERRASMSDEEREAHREKRQSRRDAAREQWDSMSDEEREAAREQVRERRKQRPRSNALEEE